MIETLPLITVADLHIHECGPDNAPTICFLHGGGTSGWMWSPQIAAFQDTYHCLIPDLPEHGLSAGVRPFSIADATHRVAQLIRQRAHGGRAYVIGLSELSTAEAQAIGIKPVA